MTLALEQSDAHGDAVERLLKGAVDLHCHSGPSVMPRDFDHIAAAEEADASGFSAVLFKDHYYSVAPVVKLLEGRLDLRVRMLSGIALNNAVGGLNRFAVDHAIQLGACLVWMPTFSSANHLKHHETDADFDKKFPTPLMKMLAPVPLRVLDANGALVDEVKVILDLIAEHDIVLSAGHLHISEIWPLFEEGRARGVERLLVNHPNYIVDATLADVSALSGMGAFLEHSMCMYVEGSKFKFYEPSLLQQLIEAGTVDRTILGSDLGQRGNPRPVEGFRQVIQMCLDLGYDEVAVRKMVGGNAKALLGLEDAQ